MGFTDFLLANTTPEERDRIYEYGVSVGEGPAWLRDESQLLRLYDEHRDELWRETVQVINQLNGTLGMGLTAVGLAAHVARLSAPTSHLELAKTFVWLMAERASGWILRGEHLTKDGDT